MRRKGPLPKGGGPFGLAGVGGTGLRLFSPQTQTKGRNTPFPIADNNRAVHHRSMSNAPSKLERMELRKDIGNREVSVPRVPPYHRGPDYLIAHACFDCRKSWKRDAEREQACPECQKPLALMGRTFRAPANRKLDQWEKVRRLWNAGFRFWSYRSFPNAERLPDDLRDVDSFISRSHDHPMRVKT